MIWRIIILVLVGCKITTTRTALHIRICDCDRALTSSRLYTRSKITTSTSVVSPPNDRLKKDNINGPCGGMPACDLEDVLALATT